MITINKVNVLRKISNDKISLEKAYELMYPKRRIKRAKFVKLKFRSKESKGATFLMRTLFLLPVPISLLKRIFKNNDNEISKQLPISIKDALNMIAVKNAFIKINSSDQTKITIKTL